MDVTYLNAAILPLFITWFIPVAIRDQETGKFKGFLQRDFYIVFVILVALQTYLLVGQYGLDSNGSIRLDTPLPDAIDLLINNTVSTIVFATLFVKWTHRKLYGTTIKFTRWW